MAIGNLLRGLGSVLNPQVAQEMAQEDRQQLGVANQVGLLGLKQRMEQQSPEYQARMEALKNERSFRQELSELGPNPDLKTVATIATKYGKPEIAANLFKAQEDRLSRVQMAADALEARKLQMVNNHELALNRITDQRLRAEEIKRHNQALEALGQQSNALKLQIADLKNETPKPPSGYRWKEGQPGVLEPIPGGPATVQSPEQAAKTELLANGIKDVERYRDLVMKDGKIDRQIILGMATPGMAGVPGTNSRLAYSYIYNAIEAKLRAESGAAVPETEVQRMAKRFVPSPLDNDATIKSKVDRLEEFLGGSLGRVKGQPGAGVPKPNIDDLVKKYAQ